MPLPVSERLDICSVLILKGDRLYAELLAGRVRGLFPAATCQVAVRVSDALQAMLADPVDLLVSGIGLPDSDVTEVLAMNRLSRPFRRVLVITTLQKEWVAHCLTRLPLDGVLDASQADHEALDAALLNAALGDVRPCRSPASLSGKYGLLLRAILSRTEQLVLAAICDGCDDLTAAGRLGMTPGAVLSVRRRLHTKLGVQTRSDLVRMAGQFGLIRFSHEGIVRTGFKLLVDSLQRRPRAEAQAGSGPGGAGICEAKI